MEQQELAHLFGPDDQEQRAERYLAQADVPVTSEYPPGGSCWPSLPNHACQNCAMCANSGNALTGAPLAR